MLNKNKIRPLFKTTNIFESEELRQVFLSIPYYNVILKDKPNVRFRKMNALQIPSLINREEVINNISKYCFGVPTYNYFFVYEKEGKEYYHMFSIKHLEDAYNKSPTEYYISCLNALCRRTINYQAKQYYSTVKDACCVECLREGKKNYFNIQIDHKDNSFDTIFHNFFYYTKPKLVIENGDIEEDKNQELIRNWQKFHNHWATYQLLCPRHNAIKSNTDIPVPFQAKKASQSL